MNISALISDKKRLTIVAASALVLIGVAGYFAFIQFSSHPEYRAAQTALDKRDFASASNHLRKYLEARPGDTSARLLLARTVRRQGDVAEALELLAVYTREAGANADSDLEHQLLRVQAGDLEKIDALLTRCTEQSPDTPLILEAAIEGCLVVLVDAMQKEMAEDGRGEIRVADYKRAQAAVEQWLGQRPANVDQVQGFVWRGKLHAIAREFPKAFSAFRKALEIDPDHFIAREFLGVLLVPQSPAEAAAHLQVLYDRDPHHRKVSFNLAKARRALGELDRAGAILDGLLVRHSHDAAILVERGSVAMDQRRYKDAEHWLEQAVTVAPNHAQANLLYSQSLQENGKPADAKKYHDRYVEIDRATQSKRDVGIKKS
ncbi:MAG: tetratricopeptide repeat protein [Planctomycetes bacterium]|nr:tetratricopeptide repeat protein [Planctomycetota bacterium]